MNKYDIARAKRRALHRVLNKLSNIEAAIESGRNQIAVQKKNRGRCGARARSRGGQPCNAPRFRRKETPSTKAAVDTVDQVHR